MSETVQQLLTKSQAELDALFSSKEAGPIPERPGRRHRHRRAGHQFQRRDRQVGQRLRLAGQGVRRQGRTLRNRILPFGLNAIIAKVYKAPSWLDGKECIVLDYSETSMVAHWIRDEIRLIEPPNIYLGKVYWNKSRLIDFALEF